MERRLLVFAALLFATLSYLLAQEDQPARRDTIFYISPVIVTATHARERETPVTFSDIDAQEIKERYAAQDVPSLLSELPSIVHYSQNGNDIGYTFLNLRGFEQRRISVMINGVPQNDPEDHQVYWIDMPDLLEYSNSIQIQRGAGSAFYGPAAIGGSINIETMPATSRPKISLSSDWGFQEFGGERRTVLNTRKYSLGLSSGLISNRYVLYGNLSKINSEGYREHSWVDLESYYVGAARFDESMTTRINVYGGPITDGLAYVGIPKFYNDDKTLRRINYSYWEFDSTGTKVNYYVPQKPQANESFFQPHYEILHEWKLSPRLTLYNTLFYIQGDGYFDYDGDWVWFDPTASNWFHSIVGYDSTFGTSKFPSLLLRGFVGNKQWGWLPRIEIEHDHGKLTLGGELRLHRSVHWGKIQFATEYPSSTFNPDFHFYEYNGKKDIASLYGHEVFRLDDATTLMADLQFAYNAYGIHDEKFLGNSFDIPYYFVNPRLGVNRNFSEELSGYVSVAYTSREPTLRNLYAGEDAWFGARPQFEATTVGGTVNYRFDQPYAKPENLLDVEFGSSYLFGKGKASVNLYWMEFRDELIQSGKLDIFGAPVTGNAERTRHVGLELTAKYTLTSDLELSGNATISSNKLVKYTFYDTTVHAYHSLDGNPIAQFPDVLANWRLAYRAGRFYGSVLMKYVGAFYTDNLKNENNKVDPYTVFDFDGSYSLPALLDNTGIAVTLKVQNLFNKLYMAGGQGDQFFPAAERSYFLGLAVNL
jgi:iron complex outermembrane receptor protein